MSARGYVQQAQPIKVVELKGETNEKTRSKDISKINGPGETTHRAVDSEWPIQKPDRISQNGHQPTFGNPVGDP